MNTYQNKNIWIIGASTGIGKALAQTLANQGAHVIISARNKEALQDAAKEIKGTPLVKAFDVTDLDAFTKTANDIQTEVTHIDSCILLAGMYDPKLIQDMDIQTAHKIIDVNLKGALNFLYIMLPILNNQNGGQLALTGSVAGYRGLPKGQPYSATKAAIMNLAESLRVEQPNLDIRLISPGFVETPMTDKNDFEMPMVIKPDQAADHIAKGLLSNAYEVHFPKKFTYIMKLIRIIPTGLFFVLSRKMMAQINERSKS